MAAPSAHLTRILETNPGVEAGYRHYPKRVTAGIPLELPSALLKWYDLFEEERPVPPEVSRVARECLESSRLEAEGLGFVLLHRCGEGFYFLIVSTWRNSNELWETVFYKNDESMPAFAPFARDAAHKPTFCVWELVPVMHEQRVWERFLASSRDEAAAAEWFHDCYEGPA